MRGRSIRLCALLLVAATIVSCGSFRHGGGNPQESPFALVWPAEPDVKYWGTWHNPAGNSWLQIEGTGQGNAYSYDAATSSWVRTPLRTYQQWGWHIMTEAGARYGLGEAGDDWITVTGENMANLFGLRGSVRYERAQLPPELASAVPFQQWQARARGLPTTPDFSQDAWE